MFSNRLNVLSHTLSGSHLFDLLHSSCLGLLNFVSFLQDMRDSSYWLIFFPAHTFKTIWNILLRNDYKQHSIIPIFEYSTQQIIPNSTFTLPSSSFILYFWFWVLFFLLLLFALFGLVFPPSKSPLPWLAGYFRNGNIQFYLPLHYP